MRKLLTLLLAVPLLVACNKKKEEDNSAPKTVAPAPTPPPQDKPATPPPPPAAKATPEDKAKRYTECWGFFNAKDWDKFKTCYSDATVSEWVDSGMPAVTGANDIIAQHAKPLGDAFPDAKGDVEVVLVNGANAASFALISGTQNGVLKTPMGDIQPTKKKIGMQVAHVTHFNDDGKTVDHEWYYQDFGQLMAQLGLSKAPARAASDKPWGPTETVIAKDDATEKKNLETSAKGMELFNKHDAKGLGELFAKDLVWSESGVPKDWNKAEAITAHEHLFKAFSDLKITPGTTWAAGDYVVSQGTLSGTNDGAAPDMGIKAKTGKPVTLQFVQMFKYDKDGKLTRSYGYWNGAAFAMQLGLMPMPTPGKDEKPAGKDEKPAGKDTKPADKKPAK